MVDYHSERQEQADLTSRNTFTKGDRLLKRSDFQRLRQTGKRIQNRHFIAYVCKNDRERCRLGMTVTRRVGKATTRNRIKRLAREYFRQNRQIFREYLDISLIAKYQSANIPNQAVSSSLENIFVRIAAYRPD